MKDKLLHLPSEGSEGLESFLLVFFLCTYKHGFLFLHMWFIASTQMWSMTFLWCDRNKTGPNQENSVPSGSSSHSLMLDRLESLVIYESALFSVFNQKKMWVKIQHQMEALNLIYMAPNMTVLTNVTIFNIHFAMSNETWRCQ